jgi:NAD+--asparagine ADP-ribosyltransferase
MFIEKRWRYGEYSADKTLPIEDCEIQYKRCYERKSSIFKSKRYSLGKGDSAFFKNLKDTFKVDIIYRKDVHKIKSDYDSVPKIGKLILYATE